MGKKRRSKISKSTIFAIILSVIVIAGTYLVLIIPSTLKNRLPGVAVISPQRTSYTPSVSCKGVIGYSELDEITLEIPVVLSQLLVARGDRVDAGQVVATIDKDRTIAVISELYGSEGFESGELYTMLKKAGDRITATDSGVIYDIARKGEVIMQGDSIAEIGRSEKLSMTAVVPERSISKVGAGQRVEISAEATSEEIIGKVVSVSSLASKLSNGRTEETVVEVEIAIESDARELKSGYTASGKILTGLETSILTLPYSAICQDDKGEYVFILSGGRAHKHYIKTGTELSDSTEVYGIEDTAFVIGNPDGLTDGMLVKTEEAEE